MNVFRYLFDWSELHRLRTEVVELRCNFDHFGTEVDRLTLENAACRRRAMNDTALIDALQQRNRVLVAAVRDAAANPKNSQLSRMVLGQALELGLMPAVQEKVTPQTERNLS